MTSHHLHGNASAWPVKARLFATDSTFTDRVKTEILAGDIETAIKDLKSEKVAVFLDFNLKAYDSKEAMLAPNIIDFVRVFLGLKEKEDKNLDAEPPPGWVVLRSGNGIQIPLSVGKNGLFTSVVADALKEKPIPMVMNRTALSRWTNW